MSRDITNNNEPIPITGIGQYLAHNLIYQLKLHPFKGFNILQQIVLKLMIPEPKGTIICTTIYGFTLIVDPVVDKGIERDIYRNGFYEAGTIDVIRKSLRENDTFFDVGSNIGLMSLAGSKFVGKKGKVYSFEPEPEMFSILQRNIEINKANNIFAHNIALGSAKRKAFIYSNLDINRASASLLPPIDKHSEGKEVLVERLDEIITAYNIKGIRMLKIDVEGWELEVLKGAKHLLNSSGAPIICIEYSTLHPTHNGQLLDIYNFIKVINDYHVYKLYKGKETPSKLVKIRTEAELPRHDNLFCFLPSHLLSLAKNMFY